MESFTMTSIKGYVYAYRQSWTHPAFNNLREASIWNFLYQNAFWEDGERNFNGYTFKLKRGQIVVSISFLAKGFCMTDKGMRVVIQKLEKLGMVATRGSSRGTIVTICNYEKYQRKEKAEGQPEGNRGANRGQTEGDNKNEGNEGNEGNEVPAPKKPKFIIPDWMPTREWDDFAEHRGKSFTDNAKKLIVNKLDKWRMLGQDPAEILNNSTMNGWKGVFELKGNNQSKANQSMDGKMRAAAQAVKNMNEAGY